MSDRNPLIGKLDGVSSSGADNKKIKPRDTHLPNEYIGDRLVLLPVNAHTQHFYWELTDRELQAKLINRVAKYEIRVYILNDGKKELIDTLEIHTAKGNHYSYSTPNLKQMQALLVEIGEFGEKIILSSNIITAPSSGFHANPWEIWMNKNGDKSTLETRASVDILDQSLVSSPSSLDQVIKNENLRARMGDFGLSNPSSDFASNHLFGSIDKAKGN